MVRMKWLNGTLVPASRDSHAALENMLENGKNYDVNVVLPTTQKSRGHFFCSLAEAFSNLPEAVRLDIPSVEHLRKRALIHTGWAHKFVIPCSSGKGLKNLWRLMRETDEYVVCIEKPDNVLEVYKARSMSSREMQRTEFQRCKDDVLKYAWGLVGIDPPSKADLEHA